MRPFGCHRSDSIRQGQEILPGLPTDLSGQDHPQLGLERSVVLPGPVLLLENPVGSLHPSVSYLLLLDSHCLLLLRHPVVCIGVLRRVVALLVG